MVQSASWVWFPHARGGNARHLRPYGDAAAFRNDGAAPRPVRPGALRAWSQGADGRRSQAGERTARTCLALADRLLLIMLRARIWRASIRLAAAFLLAGAGMLADVLPMRAGGQETIDIVTRTGVH